MGFDSKKNLTISERLTTPEFWDAAYKGRGRAPLDIDDWRNYSAIQTLNLIESLLVGKKKVCEVGGGDAQITCHLAKYNSDVEFSILDYSPIGCELARSRAAAENVELEIIQEDLFSLPEKLHGSFDLILSLGVVEHFSNLSDVMLAKRQLINAQGQIFTLIPNFDSPIYTALCKRWSISVFEDHVPHSLKSFLEGHQKANLLVTKSGYLSSVEFGMLSMAMAGPEKKTKLDNEVYLWLTRLSKAIHYLEYNFFNFPSTRLLSPFIYAVSKKTI